MKLNIDLRGFDTVYDLSLTRHLFDTLEEELKRVQKETAEEFERDTPAEDEEDYMILQSMLNGLERQDKLQERALRSAEIIRLFVLFEGHLKDVCKAAAKQQGLDLRLRDFNGGLTEKAKLFLADYAKLLPKDHPVWGPVGSLQRLRNYLVHSSVDQRSADASKELARLDKSFQKFDLIEDGELTLPKELCDFLHESVANFFKAVFDTLGWKSFKQ
jgi:hypothetical protein